MADPYPRGDRNYRPPPPRERGYPREEYPEDYDYYPAGRGQQRPPPEPSYPRHDRYQDPYRDPRYDSIPPASAPRDYRPPPPVRPEEYPRRPAGGYPPASRGGAAEYDQGYYPPAGYRPPPRDIYASGGGGYPPEPYQDDYTRRTRREEDFEYPSHRDYPDDYSNYPPPTSGRPRPRTYERQYEEPGVQARRPPRDPLPPAEELYHEFTLPAEGIRKDVIQRDITLFLGNDAVMRGPIPLPDGSLVYKYQAYRQFTPEQIKDLKMKSARGGQYDGYSSRREEPPRTSDSRRRPREEEPPMIPGGIDPKAMDETGAGYTYVNPVPGSRQAASREIPTTRSGHEPLYGTSYHETSRRPPIKATAMRDEDDDMDG